MRSHFVTKGLGVFLLALSLPIIAEPMTLSQWAKKNPIKVTDTVKSNTATSTKSKTTPAEVNTLKPLSDYEQNQIIKHQQEVAAYYKQQLDDTNRRESAKFWREMNDDIDAHIARAKSAYKAEYYKEDPDYWKLNELAKEYQRALDRKTE